MSVKQLKELKPSEIFERHIHRIHELLEGSDADVRWDERIPDLDNPKQPRQIDVTIRRDGFVTHVECRLHEAAQDVQWIEGLMGRRLSLGADAVIAVSSSGFTEGALAKAKRHGIVTRDLKQLSAAEVSSWGNTIELIGIETLPPRGRIDLDLRWISE